MIVETHQAAILRIGVGKAFQLACDFGMAVRLGKKLRNAGGAVGEASPEHFRNKKGLPRLIRKITMKIPKSLSKPGTLKTVHGGKLGLWEIPPLGQQLPDAALGLFPGDKLF